jgi:hypothetical protein
MIVYFIIFLLSVSGIAIIALRHRQEISEFNFSLFMEGALERGRSLWFAHGHGYSLRTAEKILRKLRIGALKAEHFLFRKAAALRKISKRAENENGEHTENTPE